DGPRAARRRRYWSQFSPGSPVPAPRAAEHRRAHRALRAHRPGAGGGGRPEVPGGVRGRVRAVAGRGAAQGACAGARRAPAVAAASAEGRPAMRTLSMLAALLPAAAPARHTGPWPALDPGVAGQPATMLALLAALSLLPFAVIMLTSVSKITVVLSLARSAMGTQQAPPTIILTGLAAVLTAHIMAPVVERMVQAGEAASAQVESGADLLEAARATAEPLRQFLLKHASPEERARFADLARELRPPSEAA